MVLYNDMKTHTLCIKWSKPIRNVEILKSTKRLIFQNRKDFLSNIFLSASRVFWGGHKRIQCLPFKCPWRKVEASKETSKPRVF